MTHHSFIRFAVLLGGLVLIPSAILLISAAVSGREMMDMSRIEGNQMGARFCVLVDDSVTVALTGEEDRTLKSVNSRTGEWHRTSVLSRVGVSLCSDWQPLTTSTIGSANKLLQLSKINNGTFDITIAPLLNPPKKEAS